MNDEIDGLITAAQDHWDDAPMFDAVTAARKWADARIAEVESLRQDRDDLLHDLAMVNSDMRKAEVALLEAAGLIGAVPAPPTKEDDRGDP